MFSSVAFDVVIGLIFVYILYSLLATILGELIATAINLRAVMLRIAIERILNDGYYKEKDDSESAQKNGEDQFVTKAKQFFSNGLRYMLLRAHPDFSKSFAGRFYEYPSIKYLSKVDKSIFNLVQNRPTYFSDENFADTLVNMFKDKGVGASVMEKVNFALKYNTLQIQPQTSKHIQNIFDDAQNDERKFRENLKKWFNDTMDRTNGWYKRKMQLLLFILGFIISIAFNINSIKIARILANDKEARGQLVNMGIALSKDTSRYYKLLNSGDKVPSRSVIDTGYNRVTKDIDEASSILGLGWDFSQMTKDDTLAYKVEKQANGISVYILPEIVQLSDTFKKYKETTAIQSKISQFIYMEIDSNKFIIDSLALDTAGTGLHDARRGQLADAISKDLLLKLSVQHQSSKLEADTKRLKGIKAVINNQLANNTFKDIDSFKATSQFYSIIGKKKYALTNKIYFVAEEMFCNYGWLGFLLTAIAISLGAPFWFDLLSKVASIRSAGVKPEEKKDSNSKTPDQADPAAPVVLPTIARQPDKLPVEKAVSQAIVATKNIPNIISIYSGYKRINSEKCVAIEVHASREDSLNKAKNILTDTYDGIPVNYILNSIARAHTLSLGGQISNISKANGYGTLGCSLTKDGSGNDMYFISCWHVLKGDSNWWVNSGSANIVGDDDTSIGTLVEGTITDTFDIGFFKGNLGNFGLDNKSLGIKHNWRTVTPFDSLNDKKVAFRGFATPNGQAQIWNDSADAQILYNTFLNFTDLVTLVSYDDKGNAIPSSKEGDSGSVVVDEDGFPIGIIIGGDDVYTYVAKFSNILAKNKPYSEYLIKIN